ncbi:ABC transporter permease [Afifella sp. IM 167]|uniref:ABC transporter permease n=1 Tax=Afifella sp. IM 167 TaxID=2033586 RepID=UPI001CCAA528|nr:ABC transporter permease [Afifella sp. IM 167]MBZ8134779.1 ABC transporter permease [Afifella sp. IM 167]
MSLDRVAADRGIAISSTRKHTSRWVILALQIFTFVFIVLVWEFGARLGYIDEFFFSKPTDIAALIYKWFATGFIWLHLGTTLLEAFLSFVIGTILGIIFGVALARIDLLCAVLDPYIRILNALPRVILAPIFLIWFGLGLTSKVALGISLTFFVVFFNTLQGVREVDNVILNNARMLQASDRQLMRYVYMPSAMSWILSSLHVSIGFALIGAVIGEYMGSTHGMGYLVAQAQGLFNTTGVFAGLIVTSTLVLAIDMGIIRLERYLLRWRPKH